MLNLWLKTEVTMVLKSLNQMSWLRSGWEVRIRGQCCGQSSEVRVNIKVTEIKTRSQS